MAHRRQGTHGELLQPAVGKIYSPHKGIALGVARQDRHEVDNNHRTAFVSTLFVGHLDLYGGLYSLNSGIAYLETKQDDGHDGA